MVAALAVRETLLGPVPSAAAVAESLLAGLSVSQAHLLGETLRGRSLAAIGAESGVTRQAVHARLRSVSRRLGLDVERFRELVAVVQERMKAERAADLAERGSRLVMDDPLPRRKLGPSRAVDLQRALDAWKARYVVADAATREGMAAEGVRLFDLLAASEGYGL